MPAENFIDLVQSRILLCDGGMGTQFYNKGIFLQPCSDELNLVQPELVKEVHRDYLRCGVDIIETNTFAANRFKLKKFGLDDKVEAINRAGALLAQEEAGDTTFVAGSIGPPGLKIQPWGATSVAEAAGGLRERA